MAMLLTVASLSTVAACGGDAAPDQAVQRTTSALWYGCTPNANQVAIYTDPGYSGPCAVLDVGNYPYPMSALPGGTFSSMWIGANVRAAAYTPFLGSGTFEGPYATNTGTPIYGVTVQPNNGHILAGWFKGDYPRDRANWLAENASNGPQGLAHDANNWYLTRTTAIYRVPLTSDLSTSTDPPFSATTYLPDPRWGQAFRVYTTANNYNHYGDPDVYGNYLFVPVESGNAGVRPGLYVFRLSDMSLVRIDVLDHASATANKAPWLAIDSHGILYTSNGHLGAPGADSGGLDRYSIDLTKVETGQPFLTYRDQMPVYDLDGYTTLSLETMQGGVFSTDDSILYLSNSGSGGQGAGLRAIELSPGRVWGTLKGYSYGFGPFYYQIDAYQEPEGMDYLDVTTFPSTTNLPPSQLHVLLFSNISVSFWLKHYAARTSMNQAFQKPATQISTALGATASRAVDGYADGNFWDGSVSHTDLAANPWWQVDLGTSKNIDQVMVFNRTDCCADRLQGWTVSLSEDGSNFNEIFADTTPGGAPFLTSIYPTMPQFNGANAGTFYYGPPWTGRYVRVTIYSPAQYLHMAEVIVDGF